MALFSLMPHCHTLPVLHFHWHAMLRFSLMSLPSPALEMPVHICFRFSLRWYYYDEAAYAAIIYWEYEDMFWAYFQRLPRHATPRRRHYHDNIYHCIIAAAWWRCCHGDTWLLFLWLCHAMVYRWAYASRYSLFAITLYCCRLRRFSLKISVEDIIIDITSHAITFSFIYIFIRSR